MNVSNISSRSPIGLSILVCLIASILSAKPVPENLGNGLDKLVESNLILKGIIPPLPADPVAKPNGSVIVAGKNVTTYDGYATRPAANYGRHAITNPVSKNYMVDIVLSGTIPFADVQNALTTKFNSLQITAVDAKYRGVGVIEGYVSIEDVVAISETDGVRSVHLALKPYHSRHLTGQRLPAAPAVAAPLG